MKSETDPLGRIHSFVAEVWRETGSSSEKFPKLFRKGDPKYPIPFFGNVRKAEIFTVGLNPSAGEFNNRGWHDGLSCELLTSRLLAYHSSSPHDWFGRWSDALTLLIGSPSYAEGNVAHLDVSPRATQSFGSMDTEQAVQFQKMLRQDIGWLFQSIAMNTSLKLILMAGTASHDCYLDRLVGECADLHSCKLAPKKSADGIQCRFWQLQGNGASIPVFFSGSSPSDRKNPKRLFDNVRANVETLNAILVDV